MPAVTLLRTAGSNLPQARRQPAVESVSNITVPNQAIYHPTSPPHTRKHLTYHFEVSGVAAAFKGLERCLHTANPDVAHIRFQTYRLLGSRFQSDKGRLVRLELFNIAAVCVINKPADFLYSSYRFYRGSIFHVFTPMCISKINILLCLFFVVVADGLIHSILLDANL